LFKNNKTAGVDEVGRGCLAGPVFAAAVILNNKINTKDIKDSKKIPFKKRILLSKYIKKNSMYAIGSASVKEIGKINILNASLLSMQRALKKLKRKPSIAYIDGPFAPKNVKMKCKTFIKGDEKVTCIAAASIIAKVARDLFMIKLGKKYPKYYWNKNFGYGTPDHLQGLKKYGVSNHHRKKYLDITTFFEYNFAMTKEVTTISPEGLEVANSYLTLGNIKGVCEDMQVTENKVVDILNRREVKKYIDTVYLDLGYRNKNNIASLLDDMINSKLEEAQETGVYSSKDLADLLQMAHKMRMDEIKAQADLEKAEGSNIRNQTNVQINDGIPFGQGNYGKLMDKLLNGINA
jgi:ribonuclease HII